MGTGLPRRGKPLSPLQRELVKLLARAAARDFLLEQESEAPTVPATVGKTS